jgi:Glycosyltransferase sugar-binding region containing DXD motif
MRFLEDERLYSRTEDCLRFLRGLGQRPGGGGRGLSRRFHLYWRGAFGRKQAFALKSLLATQEAAQGDVWLWLDAADGYDEHERNPFLRPLLPWLRVVPFDAEVAVRGTPIEGRPELYRDLDATALSNCFRFVTLYRHGGVYADMDTMFLRDLNALFHDGWAADEFCYRWSAHLPYANSAILALRAGSEIAHALLLRCREAGSCRPATVLRFDETRRVPLLVLPCVTFDPLWPHHDRQDRYAGAPFQRFADFFRRFGWRMRRAPTIRSHQDFFPGAFAYHWHNCWGAHEHADSYFGLFEREFDDLLQARRDLPVGGV